MKFMILVLSVVVSQVAGANSALPQDASKAELACRDQIIRSENLEAEKVETQVRVEGGGWKSFLIDEQKATLNERDYIMVCAQGDQVKHCLMASDDLNGLISSDSCQSK